MSRFGKIGDQYFDDAGNPLISGKLYFYDSGTTTLKDTFADVNLAIKNTNPVILTAAGRQPNIFFNGSARAVLTSNDDVQIEVRDPEGGGGLSGNFDAWNSLTIYNTSDIVVGGDDRYYKSFIDNNQGNEPSISPEAWQEIEFIEVWNSAVSYPLNATVKGSDGFFYASLVAANLGNDPTVSPTKWGPIVEVIFPTINTITARLYSFDNFFGY